MAQEAMGLANHHPWNSLSSFDEVVSDAGNHALEVGAADDAERASSRMTNSPSLSGLLLCIVLPSGGFANTSKDGECVKYDNGYVTKGVACGAARSLVFDNQLIKNNKSSPRGRRGRLA
ncbi:MAG: hypothetical protein MZW92_08250 [Comamonadaceae bacterium]|nr:hypothetical protein [Comamonadaceae bacterium]